MVSVWKVIQNVFFFMKFKLKVDYLIYIIDQFRKTRVFAYFYYVHTCDKYNKLNEIRGKNIENTVYQLVSVNLTQKVVKFTRNWVKLTR